MALIQFTITVNADGTITAAPSASQLVSLDPGDRVQFVETTGRPVVVNAGDTVTYTVKRQLDNAFLASTLVTKASANDEVQVTLAGANDPGGDGGPQDDGI